MSWMCVGIRKAEPERKQQRTACLTSWINGNIYTFKET